MIHFAIGGIEMPALIDWFLMIAICLSWPDFQQQSHATRQTICMKQIDMLLTAVYAE